MRRPPAWSSFGELVNDAGGNLRSDHRFHYGRRQGVILHASPTAWSWRGCGSTKECSAANSHPGARLRSDFPSTQIRLHERQPDDALVVHLDAWLGGPEMARAGVTNPSRRDGLRSTSWKAATTGLACRTASFRDLLLRPLPV